MNALLKTSFRILGPIALIIISIATPYFLFKQGSAVLMENILFFIAFFLTSIVVALWTWGLERIAGLVFMLLSVVMLVIMHITGFTFSNRLLLIAVILLLLGIFLHVWSQKRESKY